MKRIKNRIHSTKQIGVIETSNSAGWMTNASMQKEGRTSLQMKAKCIYFGVSPPGMPALQAGTRNSDPTTVNGNSNEHPT